ncbi:MAG: hypothetical protein ACYDBB_23655 [Armatimonadota bacterium]
MNWIIWALLIVGLVLLIVPFAAVVSIAVESALWIIGALLVLAAVIWAISTLGRAATTGTTTAR